MTSLMPDRNSGLLDLMVATLQAALHGDLDAKHLVGRMLMAGFGSRQEDNIRWVQDAWCATCSISLLIH
eukprot:359219-Chlamydomonas_euryale.AAC.21